MFKKIIALQLAFFCAIGNTGIFAVAEEETDTPDTAEETIQEQEPETEAEVSGEPDIFEEEETADTELSSEEDESAAGENLQEEIEELNIDDIQNESPSFADDQSAVTENGEDVPEASAEGSGLLGAVWDGVRYVEYEWNGTEAEGETKTRDDVRTVPEDGSMTSGWYYLNKNITVSSRIYLTGDTWLILGDNCTLNVKGLYVPAGSTLTIYAQSIGAEKGTLISKPNNGGAGIGATSDNHPGGNIVIHGGNIEAEGDNHCAGIGSNDGNGTTAPITIYGGMITAKGGSDGAGIGGGRDCDGGTITIYGGEITAKGGGENGAGIGGGDSGDGGFIEIFDGIITVNEDPNEDGAAIGGGDAGEGGNIAIHGGTITAWSRDGACIGGGDNGEGGTIIINGGTITCRDEGMAQGARIGGGSDADGGSITINGGTVTVYHRDGAGIGGGEDNDGGNITITGGNVYSYCAEGSEGNGAGIGGGNHSGAGGTITITGGYVEVKNNHSAAIGGGRAEDMKANPRNSGAGGTITITGGEVRAEAEYAFAIGAGGQQGDIDFDEDGDSDCIGTAGTIVIGGTAAVWAYGCPGGIGGDSGKITIQDSCHINAGGWREDEDDDGYGAGIKLLDDSDNSYVLISGGNSRFIGRDDASAISLECRFQIAGGSIYTAAEDKAIDSDLPIEYYENAKFTVVYYENGEKINRALNADERPNAYKKKYAEFNIFPCSHDSTDEHGLCPHCWQQMLPVTYIERSWDGSKVVDEEKTSPENTVILSGSDTIEGGWYYLSHDVTVNKRVSLTGDTYLILGDERTLDIKGLYVPAGATLTIYAQSDGENAGRLISMPNNGGAGIGATSDDHPGGRIVIHGGNIETEGDNHCAGIGSNDGNETTAPITIYGGTITATGGDEGAGIGGGRECDGGTITIYGGEITAEGGENNGAGIGGGKSGDGGTIIIYGGNVTATGGDDGAGIGGGNNGSGGTITIKGGEITAKGGEDNGAGIGGGNQGDGGTIDIYGGTVTVNEDPNENGAGIGGGYRADGGNITIHGGTITTYSRDGAGIGGGDDGDSGTIIINGGTITANEFNQSQGARIGSGCDGIVDTITINGGTITTYSGKGAGIGGGKGNKEGGTITINGGVIDASGGSGSCGIGKGLDGNDIDITLGYTEETKDTISITSKSYGGAVTLNNDFASTDGTIAVAEGTYTNITFMDGKTLVPFDRLEVSYVDLNNEPQSELCLPVTSGTTEWNNTWYAVTSNVTISKEIVVTGDVNLILADNCKLDAKNIKVAKGNKLTIWGQRNGSGTVIATSDHYAKAGIGGADSACGTIIINGGTVNATGGSYSNYSGSAGIGAACYRITGTVIINGGTVTATGGQRSAGIGGAYSDPFNNGTNPNGIIEINGGTVTAVGTNGGAGIGAGYTATDLGGDNASGHITINGGIVTAYGSECTYKEGQADYTNTGGAGIGGTYSKGAGIITINGGTVNAYGTKSAPAIGTGGMRPKLDHPRGGSITITGGTVNAIGASGYAAAIGGGRNGGDVIIDISGGKVTATGGWVGIGYGEGCSDYPCTTTLSWTKDNWTDMSVTCISYNGIVILDNVFKDMIYDRTYGLGEVEDLSSLADSMLVPFDSYTVRFLPGYENPVGSMPEEVVFLGDEFVLPECTYEWPEDMVFAGWLSEDGRLYQANTMVEIFTDSRFTAQWRLNYDLKVGGVQVTPENKDDILNDGGSAVFDYYGNILTLNGEYDFSGQNYDDFVFAQEMDLTIAGDAVIEADDMKSAFRVVYGSLTLNGNFECRTGDYCMFASNGINVQGGRITAESSNNNSAISALNGDIVFGKDVEYVDASSLQDAVHTEESIVIDDSLYIKVPENGHVNGGIIETEEGGSSGRVVIEPQPVTEPEFKGHQLVLSGSLGLKFGVKFPEGFDSSGSYVTFTVNNAEQTVNTSDAEDVEGRKVYTCYLNTLQMAEEIQAVFHYGDGQTVEHRYSLLDYFNYFDEHESEYNEKTLNLVHAVSNYGYFAYPYLVQIHHLEGKYAPITKYYTTSFDLDAIRSAVAGYTFAKGISDSDISAASYKLSLDSDTALSVMVKVPAGTEVCASAVFNGETYEMTKDSDTVWSVKIPGIKARQLGDTITVSGTSNGDFTITVSALSYVRSVLNSDKYKGDAQNAVAALYKYYEAVMAY